MIRNYILQRCNAPGTNANVLLGTAQVDRLTWAQVYGDGSPAFYFLDDGTKAEWGVCTFHLGPPPTISRDTVIGNTVGTTARLNFLGSVDCYNEIPGERMTYVQDGILHAAGWLDPQCAGVPIGASCEWWVPSFVPNGWVYLNGTSLSRTAYPTLFSLIGTTYGADDSATFKVPNTIERFCVGRSTMGGAIPINITPLPGINTIGGVLGDYRLYQHTHTLNWYDPGHAHPVTDPLHFHSDLQYFIAQSPGVGPLAGGTQLKLDVVPLPQLTTTTANATNIQIDASLSGIESSPGSGVPPNINVAGAGSQQNVPPSIVCDRIMYTGFQGR